MSHPLAVPTSPKSPSSVGSVLSPSTPPTGGFQFHPGTTPTPPLPSFGGQSYAIGLSAPKHQRRASTDDEMSLPARGRVSDAAPMPQQRASAISLANAAASHSASVPTVLYPFPFESFDELSAFESSLRQIGAIPDVQKGNPLLTKALSGPELSKGIMRLGRDSRTAAEIAQRMLDSGVLYRVDPKTNRRVVGDFSDHTGDSVYYRFESDKLYGADVVRQHSLTKFYTAKQNSLCGHFDIIGKYTVTKVFALVTLDDEFLYFFKSIEAPRPMEENSLAHATFFKTNRYFYSQMGTERERLSMDTKQQNERGRAMSTTGDDSDSSSDDDVSTNAAASQSGMGVIRGNLIVLLTPQRILVLGASSVKARRKWISEFMKTRATVLLPSQKPRRVTSEALRRMQIDLANQQASNMSGIARGQRQSLVAGMAKAPPSNFQVPFPPMGGNNSQPSSPGPSSGSLSRQPPSVGGGGSLSLPATRPASNSVSSPSPPLAPLSGSISTATTTSSSNNSTPRLTLQTEARSSLSGTMQSPSNKSSTPSSSSSPSSPIVESNAPSAPPLSPNMMKPLVSPSGISEIKSESALVRRQRMAAEALKQLQAMQIHLGFSFDAVEENDNPYLGLLVDSIEPNAPAALGGLIPGDVVLEVNGTRTLTLQDLLEGIRGLVPGTPIQFIVEREEQEVEIIVTLGGKGQNQMEVLRLYSLVQSVQNGTDELVRTGALSLSDVLETPQFRIVLLKYMESNLCAESVHFLQVEQAYQRLGDNETRRDYFAHIIANEFINEQGEQMVNIDADTRKAVLTKLFKQGDTSTLLFHDAAKVVYRMCENDVFRRFVTSNEYQSMVHEPQSWESISIRGKRRRSPSWAVLALEEITSLLEEISLSFAKTPNVQDRRYHLKKYKSCFKGSELVSWLCEVGYAKNRPAGCSIGQRLWDSFHVRHVTEEFEFEDSDKLYTFLSPFAAEPVSVAEIFTKAGGATSPLLYSAYLLVKGVRFNRLFVLIHKEKKKLFIFRNSGATMPLLKVRLKGLSYSVQQGPPSLTKNKDKDKDKTATANLMSSPSSKKSGATQPQGIEREYKRELLTYVHIDNPGRTLTFRLEGEESCAQFQAALLKSGAQVVSKE